MGLEALKTVTIELAYEDALRLWVLVHAPESAGTHRADDRIRKLVNDAVNVTEDDYTAHDDDPERRAGSGGDRT